MQVTESRGETEVAKAGAPLQLVRAAHEFEGLMLKELLKPMMQSRSMVPGGDENSGSESALGEFATEALGKAISERGGLGIANTILRDLTETGHRLGEKK